MAEPYNLQSGKPRKLGGGQEIFIFRGRLPYEGEVRKFSFSGGGCPIRGGLIFQGEVDTPLRTMVTFGGHMHFFLSEKILKFTHLKWLKNTLKLSTMVGEKFEIYSSQVAKKYI